MPTAGSKVWYTNALGVATNWGTAVSGGVATTDIYRVTKPTANEKATRKLWKGQGTPVSGAETTAAQAEADTAAVPSVDVEPGGGAGAQDRTTVANPTAIGSSVAAAAPTKAEYDLLRTDVINTRTTLTNLLNALRSHGDIG